MIYYANHSAFAVMINQNIIKVEGTLKAPVLLILISFGTLKSDSHLPKNLLFISFNENPLKITKNAFYLILKSLFVLKIFKFKFCSCRKNGLITKIRLISKILISQPGYQTITIHINYQYLTK